MILDNQALFSDAQVVNSAALIPSTNVLDLGLAGITAYQPSQLRRRMGKGMMPLLIQCVEAFAGAATVVTIQVQSCALEDFSAGIQNVISIDVPVADLIAGYISPIDKLPRTVKNRYLRLAYTANGIPTAGKFTAGIVGAVDGGYQGNA